MKGIQQLLSIILAPLKSLKLTLRSIGEEDKSLMPQSLYILVIGTLLAILLAILQIISIKECAILSIGFLLWVIALGFGTCDDLFFSILYIIKDLFTELTSILMPNKERVNDLKLYKISNQVKTKIMGHKPTDEEWSNSVEGDVQHGNDSNIIEEDGLVTEDIYEDQLEEDYIKEDTDTDECNKDDLSDSLSTQKTLSTLNTKVNLSKETGGTFEESGTVLPIQNQPSMVPSRSMHMTNRTMPMQSMSQGAMAKDMLSQNKSMESTKSDTESNGTLSTLHSSSDGNNDEEEPFDLESDNITY